MNKPNKTTRTIILKGVAVLGAFFLSFGSLSAQSNLDKDENGYLLPAIISDGDTVAMIQLNYVNVVAEMKFAGKKQRESWDRLKYNVKKAYPYAIMASARLREYENILKTLPSEEKRQAYMKVAEAQLKKEFEAQLKQLTVKQGKILIKLIDRETGRTSYELVKQLRGNFSAWMWQSLASLFGSSLKSEYDAKGEDRLIEVAIKQIEAGLI
jgi:hypothetical protein